MPIVAASSATIVAWVYYAVVNPTVGAAIVAGVASIANTLLLLRHERRVERRFDERRVGVFTSEEAVTIANEERRALEDRRAEPESRKLRDRRRRERRNDATGGP